MIITEISRVLLQFLAIVDTQLRQVKKNSNTNTAVFNRLAIVILIKNFHQFFLVTRRSLWKKTIKIDKLYGKTI